ncbi:hypothetical protein C8A00DRAFT_36614 [Chaetomidium leptoderma]|uniref:Uncharacterized protein n=1 Tax=Chaetomidium leptoderma TaxID=669021 RepID=A0AAN6ZTX1_9PEZI|nr:hypothetical protein C8A00DRAFT_36614 [Chaetomidium leptoderma]
MAPTNTFTITAGPGTDIWRKPPTTDVFNAPIALPPPNEGGGGPRPLRTTGPLTSFLSARLSLNFTPQQQYDQGGILLSFHRRHTTTTTTTPSSTTTASPPQKWIKSGIELYNGHPRLSTVSCDNWADWSVADLHQHPTSSQQEEGSSSASETGWTTMLIEKDKDVNGTGVWVYRVTDEGEKVPLREICWVFGDRPEEWDVEVHAMAARPEKAAQGGLVVEFGGLEVEWAEEA